MSNYIKKSDLEVFGHHFMLKVDVDSIYFGYHSLGALMQGFGVSVKTFVDSRKSRLDSSSSSRFGLSLKNNGYDKVRIDVNGIKPDKIGLEYIPNIKIMECQVNDISPRFYINMYFVGTDKTRPTTYLTNMELKAITALLNQAREYTINDLKSNLTGVGLEEEERRAAQVEFESFSDMCLFESITGGSQDRSIKNKQTCISNDVAISFGKSFDRALEKFADCNEEEFNRVFSKGSYVGSDMPTCRNLLRKELAEMKKFLKRLSKGVFFCASCAGCKLDFNKRENCQKLMHFDLSSEETIHTSLCAFNNACDRLQKRALKNLKVFLFQNRETRSTEHSLASLQFPYNIDVGIEISPITVGESFFLKGKEAREAAKSMLKERWMRSEDGGVFRMELEEGQIVDDGNPHLMLSNLVPSSEDRDLLDMGLHLEMSNEEVFPYGSNEEEIIPSSVSGGKNSIFFMFCCG